MKVYSFEKLNLWQESRKYVVEIYKLTNCFPREEIFGLRSQIRRTAVSVTSNIGEGKGEISGLEKARHTKIAYSSLLETFSQLINASDLGYISKDDVLNLGPKVDHVGNMLSALRKRQ